jgi:RNA polymerase sigma-70 factor (ECF subfamily)
LTFADGAGIMRSRPLSGFSENFLQSGLSKLMSSPGRSQDQAHAARAAQADAQSAKAASLLNKARNGDRGAFGQLVVLYQDRLFNAIVRLVGDRDEAAELTQETFTKSLAALADFRGESAAYTWLFRIAFNLSISRLRKVQRHRTFSLDRPGPSNPSGNGKRSRHQDQASGLMDRVRQSSPGPSVVLEQREQAEQVVAALGRVEPEYRAVLIMRDVEGFDYQQMADVLGLPLGTLKSRLFRARIALRDELKAYMGK